MTEEEGEEEEKAPGPFVLAAFLFAVNPRSSRVPPECPGLCGLILSRESGFEHPTKLSQVGEAVLLLSKIYKLKNQSLYLPVLSTFVVPGRQRMKAKTKLRGGGNCVDAANCFLNWRRGSSRANRFRGAPSAVVTTLQCF